MGRAQGRRKGEGLSVPPLSVGATLHWLNSRRLGAPALARRADIGLALSVAVTAAAFWMARDRAWSAAMPFLVSGWLTACTGLWWLAFAHAQGGHVARSFGSQYRHRAVWLAALIVAGAMLAIGFGVAQLQDT